MKTRIIGCALVLAALQSVDAVFIFRERDAVPFLQTVTPDVYVKGGDYNPESLNAEERAILEKIGAKIDIVPFVKGYSTSRLLEKLHEFAK